MTGVDKQNKLGTLYFSFTACIKYVMLQYPRHVSILAKSFIANTLLVCVTGTTNLDLSIFAEL